MGGPDFTDGFVGLLLQAQPAPSSLGFGGALLKMVAALVLVCVLAFLLLRLARRYLTGGATTGGLVRVVERCPLSARQTLWVVEVGQRCFLIGSSDGAMTRLAELDPEQVRAAVQDGQPVSRSFFDVLRGKKPPEGGA